jgi:hypothetical protein
MVNNGFIHRYNFNASRGGSLGGTSAWSHDATHRQGVPYSNAALANQYRGAARQSLQTRGQAGQTQARGPNPQSRSERVGNRQIPQSAPIRNGGAFGGVRDGGAARAQSDHGYSSLGPARSGGGMPSRMGGGGAPSRMGGGGGGGSRGGGGHR